MSPWALLRWGTPAPLSPALQAPEGIKEKMGGGEGMG
jgi:hypothetical protein